ncbi:RING finger protein 145-like [Haliotis cracherodii]|uniref:RING finger protein 145-like n=1 Tax=Haliotis cracherodii TaxID=6455 RepID=UPI0039EA53AF
MVQLFNMFKISREALESGVGVILRVPALFVMEVWYRTDPLKTVQVQTKDVEIIIKVVYYMALLFAVAIGTLPLKKLVTFYVYLVSGLMLLGSFFLSQSFVQVEVLENKEQTWADLFDDKEHTERLILHLIAQAFMAALIAYLVELKDWTRFLMLVFTLPVLARSLGFPLNDLHIVHNFASIFSTLIVLFYVFNNLGNIIDNCKEGINNVVLAFRAFGVFPVFITFWHSVLLPIQLLIFWLIMFITQLYVYLYSENHPIMQEGWIVIILASIGECCATPISLFALCVTITYASYSILTLTKLYLQGFEAWSQDVDAMRGWTEGFTMLLIAIQTDLLDLRPLQRAFLMSILLFIVASSLIQSMYEIADPVLLALSASHNKSVFKHARAVALCTFLWMFPLYMTYSICQYFDLDFWLMVIVSSCMLTSVQVIGSLAVYSLFMYDSFRNEPWEMLDDVIYCARAITRVLEFFVAVFVVCYGLKESLFGEWSWINSSILIVHCYFNVWQRLQSGWKSFLLRREASKKVESLPSASEDQLSCLDDVCAICYNEMKSARVTPCGHFFHGVCLRKWLYVKDSCPMCHRDIHQEVAAGSDAGREDFVMNPTLASQDDDDSSETASSQTTESSDSAAIADEGNVDLDNDPHDLLEDAGHVSKFDLIEGVAEAASPTNNDNDDVEIDAWVREQGLADSGGGADVRRRYGLIHHQI